MCAGKCYIWGNTREAEHWASARVLILVTMDRVRNFFSDKWDILSPPVLWIAYWGSVQWSGYADSLPWFNMIVSLSVVGASHLVGGALSLARGWARETIVAWIYLVHAVLDVTLALVLSQSLSSARFDAAAPSLLRLTMLATNTLFSTRTSPSYVSPELALVPGIVVCLLVAPTTMRWVTGNYAVQNGQSIVSFLVLLVVSGILVSFVFSTQQYGAAHIADSGYVLAILVMLSVVYGLPTRTCEAEFPGFCRYVGVFLLSAIPKCGVLFAVMFLFKMVQDRVTPAAFAPIRHLDWYYLRLSANVDSLQEFVDPSVDGAALLTTLQSEWWKSLLSVLARAILILSASYWFARFHCAIRMLDTVDDVVMGRVIAYNYRGVNELRLVSALSVVLMAVVAASKEHDYAQVDGVLLDMNRTRHSMSMLHVLVFSFGCMLAMLLIRSVNAVVASKRQHDR